jgi:hypothetical protein
MIRIAQEKRNPRNEEVLSYGHRLINSKPVFNEIKALEEVIHNTCIFTRSTNHPTFL